MSKRRIVFLRLNSKEPIHIEIISSSEEINNIIHLLESSYHFEYFSVIPVEDNK